MRKLSKEKAQKMTLCLYHNPRSRSSIALLTLIEAGVEFDTKLISFALGEHERADYQKIHPQGKVPALKTDDGVVLENHAICSFIASKHSSGRLMPEAGSFEWAKTMEWLFYNASCLEMAVTDKSLNRIDDEMASRLGYGKFDDTLKRLTTQLQSHDWLVGDKFTVADVMVGMSLNWYLEFQLVPQEQVLKDYVARLKSRPSFTEYERLTDSHLKALLEREASEQKTS